MYNIGTKLTELRKATGKTQKEVADSLGVAKSTVGNWENNKREAPYAMLKKLANFYNVTVGELFGEKNEIPSNEIKETLIEDMIDLLVKSGTLPNVNSFDELDENSRNIIKSAINKYLEKFNKK